MNDDKLKNYMVDIVFLLKEKALKLKNEPISDKDLFKKGELMGYYDILSIMIAQADIFEISLSEIGLNNFNPDSDLL